jgi:hypothetical protein
LAIKDGETLAVQTTSGSGVSARRKKMLDEENLYKILRAGWNVHIHGWRKVKVKRGGKAERWAVRLIDLREELEF